MRRATATLVAVLFLATASGADTAKRSELPVAATIETTLSTDAPHIRQFAFDGDADSYFTSVQNARRSDRFTLIFDKPVAVTSIAVTTGRPSGEERLDSGTLEVSRDGKKFEPVAQFTDGVARAKPGADKLRAVRIKPAADLDHPLSIREFTIESSPRVAVFKYPVEFVVKSDAPEMKAWVDKVAAICERAYPMINDELQSEGFKPPSLVSLALRDDYKGVAATAGRDIFGSVKYFKSHPNDVGAMVHETVHVCQRYRGKYPGWLVEGIADYIRFYKYEPGKLKPISPNRARYDASYQITARFLAYLVKQYDKEIVRKLNKAARQGEYKDELFQVFTGKPLKDLDAEWRASLRR
jgi:hypothetical protein